MEIELCAWRELSADDHVAREELGVAAYGPADDLVKSVEYADVDPDDTWVVLVREDARLVSFVAIMRRALRVDGAPADIAGIRSVKTHPEYRRRGFASSAMRLAGEFIASDIRPDFSLLWASKMAISMYARLGWDVFEGMVFCLQSSGRARCRDLMPESRVMLLLPDDGARPMASIDLCGFPF